MICTFFRNEAPCGLAVERVPNLNRKQSRHSAISFRHHLLPHLRLLRAWHFQFQWIRHLFRKNLREIFAIEQIDAIGSSGNVLQMPCGGIKRCIWWMTWWVLNWKRNRLFGQHGDAFESARSTQVKYSWKAICKSHPNLNHFVCSIFFCFFAFVLFSFRDFVGFLFLHKMTNAKFLFHFSQKHTRKQTRRHDHTIDANLFRQP